MEQTEWLTEALEPRTLYNFAGTNLMYYSLGEEIEAPDPDGHGTQTAGIVARHAPNATIVMVQHDRNFEEAAAWAANQTWVDVVSASVGFAYNGIQNYPCYATVGQVRPECAGYGDLASITHSAVESGKVWVNSAGNNPTVHLPDKWDGPPWVIAVGGADQYRRGETLTASKAPDVLSDYIVQDLPQENSVSETGWAAGTSFGTPTVSGTLANAILELRERTGYAGTIADGELVPPMEVTNHDVRSAMNRTAIYWGPQDYRPTAPGHPCTPPSCVRDRHSLSPAFQALRTGDPIAPGAPWGQMGWGYVNGSLSDDIAKVLVGNEDPAKPAGAVEYMEARQQARQAMWS